MSNILTYSVRLVVAIIWTIALVVATAATILAIPFLSIVGIVWFLTMPMKKMGRYMNNQQFLFGSGKMSEAEAIGLTIASMNEYGPRHNHWVIAWSGGKDSTATLTVILNLLDAGLIAPPKSLTVCYADTRMEIPPLWISARVIMQQLDRRGIEVIEL